MSHTSVTLVVYVRMAYIYLVAMIPLNLSLIHHVNIIMLAVCVVQTAVHACLSMITSTSHPYPVPVTQELCLTWAQMLPRTSVVTLIKLSGLCSQPGMNHGPRSPKGHRSFHRVWWESRMIGWKYLNRSRGSECGEWKRLNEDEEL